VSRIAKAIEAQGAVAAHRDRLAPRLEAPPQSPGPRTANQDQRAHPQGAPQGRARGQEVTPHQTHQD
jgi:hypothetical protein